MATEQYSSLRHCAHCGKDVSRRHGLTIFCSEKCGEVFRGRRKERTKFNCDYCGKDISNLSANTKYCSETCKKKQKTIRKGGKPLNRMEKKIPIIDNKMQCNKCNKLKLLSEFYFRKKEGWYESWCKECIRESSRIKMAERRLIQDLKIKQNLSARIYRRKTRMFGKSTNEKIAFAFRDSIKKNYNSKYFKDFGYTMQELKIHLEKQFTKGMTWDKFLKGEIHIDHIIPISSFDFNDPDHIEACWALYNLRPMWASDNIKKSNKVLNLI